MVHASALPPATLAEWSARRAYLDHLFRGVAQADLARPRNRPMDRRLRLLTVRFVPGPFDADGLRAAKRALAALVRALPDDLDVCRYAGAFAYGQRWGGWHAHLVIDSRRIDQRYLAALAARHAQVHNVQVNLLRLPGEAARDGRRLRASDFDCPEATYRLFSASIDHFDYVATQPVRAPRGCTLWVDSEPAGTWTEFRVSVAGVRRADLATVEARRSRFAAARSGALGQEGRHRDAWRHDPHITERVFPGRGRLRYVDLSAIPCAVCAAQMA